MKGDGFCIATKESIEVAFRVTKDDIETMQILFGANINELCNQGRWKDAEEMEKIAARLINALSFHRWYMSFMKDKTEEGYRDDRSTESGS